MAQGVRDSGSQVLLPRKGLRERARDRDRRERHAVADRLAHDHYVRRHSRQLKAPEGVAGAPKAGLDLVGDADGAGGAQLLVRRREPAVGEEDLSCGWWWGVGWVEGGG